MRETILDIFRFLCKHTISANKFCRKKLSASEWRNMENITLQKESPGDTNAPVIRNYKDTVFRMLFADKQNLLSLYNAVNHTCYLDPEQLEIVTIENAIYISMKNDVAFLIGHQLFLYEQQATFNPNMPLRFLQYVSKRKFCQNFFSKINRR